jgi:heavy metal sensor kinase
MIDLVRGRIPIRWRLTLWYVLLLGATFTAFSAYITFRFRVSLQAALDSSLRITVSKTIAALDEEDFNETGRLTFDHTGRTQSPSTDFAMRMLSVNGEVWDVYSAAARVPGWGGVEAEYSEQGGWRIHNRPIEDSKGRLIGWVQAAQSLDAVQEVTNDLREQLLFGLPLLLLLAGLGGYFLAGRALKPVDQITHTAQDIDLHDLSRRIGYRGAMDEVGRLARTFDQMLARLQESFERERRFTSDAAHELRTPLTALKGHVEVTLSRPRSPSEYEGKLRELAQQVDRLIRLGNALLFLSRSDQDQIGFKTAPVNVTELLGILIEQFQPFAEERNLKMRAHLQDGLSAHGDNDQLIRLFMNLLENALKYAPPHGEVTIAASRHGPWARVVFHNSGPGIGREHLPHLFERFYRVEPHCSSRSGGSGLGLAIAHEITRLHHGRIEVQSGPGQGVTFIVDLPVSRG